MTRSSCAVLLILSPDHLDALKNLWFSNLSLNQHLSESERCRLLFQTGRRQEARFRYVHDVWGSHERGLGVAANLYVAFLTQISENMTVAPTMSPLKGPDCCLEVGSAQSTPDM